MGAWTCLVLFGECFGSLWVLFGMDRGRDCQKTVGLDALFAFIVVPGSKSVSCLKQCVELAVSLCVCRGGESYLMCL